MTGNHFCQKYNLCGFVFLFVLICVLMPLGAEGAVLYLEPAGGEVRPGDTLFVEVKLDTEGECINIVEANLSFSQEILGAVDFSQGDSILALWIKSPAIDQSQGLISFAGGIPAGYCGRIPGDPGSSDLLGKIIFKVPGTIVSETRENLAKVNFLETSKALLNDGFGTPAELTTRGATFTILSEPGPSKDKWREELRQDTIPPESFEIIINQNPAVFEGKYFIIFQTQDKQTGLDYFEVKEGEGDWVKASSPYLLKNQDLESKILVKAVDKAGNERIAEYTPLAAKKPLPYLPALLRKAKQAGRGIVLILVGAGLIWWTIKRYGIIDLRRL